MHELNTENAKLNEDMNIHTTNANDNFLIEDAFKYYELLLHYMLSPKKVSSQIKIDKKVSILYYCILYRFITARQLSCMDIGSQTSFEGLCMILKRLCDKGYLSVDKTVLNERTENVYSLTIKGANFCVLALDAHMHTGSPNDPMVMVYSKIKGAPLEYLVSRHSFKNSANYSHTLGIRTLNLYLLSNTHTKLEYHYTLEVPIKPNGSVATLAERSQAKLQLRNNSFYADALLEYPVSKELYRFYIEQDTGLQRKSVLTKKIENYVDSIVANSTYKEHNTLLFSIGVSYSPKAYRLSDDTPCTSIAREYLSIAKMVAAMHQGFPSSEEHLNATQLNDITPVFRRFCDCYPGNVYYKNALAYYESLTKTYPNITLNMANSLLLQQKKHDLVSIQARKSSYLRERYNNRRNVIFAVAEANTACTDAFLDGFSLCCTNSHNHADVFPYLNPEFFNNRTILETIVSLCLLKEPITTTQYQCSVGNVREDGFVLKNHYLFNGKLNMYVENISDDLGGYHRVSYYLNNPTWMHGTGILLCLVADDDLERAKKLYMDTVYSNYIAEHPSALCNKESTTFSLQVLFLHYSQFGQKFSFFSFDTDGNEVVSVGIV